MLAGLFDNLEVDDFVADLFDQEMQSDIIHSHLEIAAATGQVAAAMNGLTSNLPEEYDRRFPLVREEPAAKSNAHQKAPNSTTRLSNPDLPDYTSVAPPVSVVNENGRFIAWNSPFSANMPCKLDHLICK